MRLVLCILFLAALASQAKPAFDVRGYYITFMRTPTLDLAAWKQTIDCVREDGGNTLLLWMGGAFPSKKFPITWKYNRDHQNVQKNFGRALIDYAHEQNIKVLLGFTPFAYDGVNQYPLEHPNLKATQQNGEPAKFWGMHSWGHNLCPAKEESQRFMLEYAREMIFDFYPNADGVLIESSDYAICYCAECKEKFFENEFRFVRKFSDEVWQRNSSATIVVFPHYFSGAKVPGFNVQAAKLPFDPRWTLVFTPHSAHIDAPLLKQSTNSIWWDDAPTLGTPEKIRRTAQRAHKAGINGFVPSLEAFTFVAEHAEGGETHLKGTRLKPFGFEWLPDGAMPFNELPVRVNRIAYREFSRNPDLSHDEFTPILARKLLNDTAAIDDLLYVQQSWMLDRTWFSASPLTRPETLKLERQQTYRARLGRIREIAERTRETEPNLHRVAQFVVNKWDAALLEDLVKSGFLYFWEAADPKTGLVKDRALADGQPDARRIGSIAATGFGLTALCIGAERGYLEKAKIERRVLTTLQYLWDRLPHEHGFFYHFIDVATGVREWKCELSSIDTGLLLCGVLTCGEYWEHPEIRRLARQIYERVDWRWMLNGGDCLAHGWKPESGFLKNRWDAYCEHMLLYLLAIGSPTHPIPTESWHAWRRPVFEYEGYRFITVDAPLFIHQYSHAWFDFAAKRDRYTDYFQNSVLATKAHKLFCVNLKPRFTEFSEDLWGVTASDWAKGYQAWGGPPEHGKLDGTLVPCAAAGSIPFLPPDTLHTLSKMRERFGEKVWKRYGFIDAFNPHTNWFAPDVIGIDVGITMLMAENHRSRLVWQTFMRNRYMRRAMDRVGFSPR